MRKEFLSMTKKELIAYLEGVRGIACYDEPVSELREVAIMDWLDENNRPHCYECSSTKKLKQEGNLSYCPKHWRE